MPKVAILMGSRNDLPVLQGCKDVLEKLGIEHEVRVISAHRALDRLLAYIPDAEARGVQVFVAGAGGAAALPGVVAAATLKPVLGVPLDSMGFLGLDALLSIVQMPSGVPVGTLAVGRAGAANAGWLAAGILATTDEGIRTRLEAARAERRRQALEGEIP
jgi:5-(carboxyamino)imidazole ribonucleotide mutase